MGDFKLGLDVYVLPEMGVWRGLGRKPVLPMMAKIQKMR
jgi:hypothetical protein